jgi:hypothetical protein
MVNSRVDGEEGDEERQGRDNGGRGVKGEQKYV